MINPISMVGFVWWIGVVEDRFDPLQAGRVRVRVHGHHTEDKTQIPTESLQWAQVMMPNTSASNSGVSETPNLIEGSHVIGFFMDGQAAQQPIVMGSIAGLPQTIANTNIGFNDPNGLYPREDVLDQPDLSKLARGESAETHPVIVSIRDAQIEKIPEAKAPSITSVADDISEQDYNTLTWNQPSIRFGNQDHEDRDYENGSKYGFNTVSEHESGHFFEVDDTPNAERLSKTHRKGTYEEIYSDGSRAVRVVSDDYEIVIGNKKCFINGNMSVTINGDAKVLVKGDKYEQIEGNYHLHVKGDRRTKIEGSEAIEILTDESKQINGNQGITITGARTDTVKQDATYVIGNDLTVTTQNDVTNIIGNDLGFVIGGKSAHVCSGQLDIGSSSNVNLASNNSVNIKSVSDIQMTGDSNFNVDVSSNYQLNTGGDITSTASGDNTVIGTKVKLNP